MRPENVNLKFPLLWILAFVNYKHERNSKNYFLICLMSLSYLYFHLYKFFYIENEQTDDMFNEIIDLALWTRILRFYVFSAYNFNTNHGVDLIMSNLSYKCQMVKVDGCKCCCFTRFSTGTNIDSKLGQVCGCSGRSCSNRLLLNKYKTKFIMLRMRSLIDWDGVTETKFLGIILDSRLQ